MMKKVFVFAALLAAACVVDANTAGSLNITLDTRTQGAGALVTETQVDSRGLTRAVSLELILDTRIPLGTVILMK